jgi:hypothetical protein
MSTSKWGDCDRCGKPSECARYTIEVLDHDQPDVCQACFDEWSERMTALLNDFMSRSAQNR